MKRNPASELSQLECLATLCASRHTFHRLDFTWPHSCHIEWNSIAKLALEVGADGWDVRLQPSGDVMVEIYGENKQQKEDFDG